jgi:hypothetical protein
LGYISLNSSLLATSIDTDKVMDVERKKQKFLVEFLKDPISYRMFTLFTALEIWISKLFRKMKTVDLKVRIL